VGSSFFLLDLCDAVEILPGSIQVWRQSWEQTTICEWHVLLVACLPIVKSHDICLSET